MLVKLGGTSVCEGGGGLLSPLLSFSFFFGRANDSVRRATVMRPPCSQRGGRACRTQSGDRKGFDASHLPFPLPPLALVRPHFLIPTRLNLRALCPITPRGGSAGGFPLRQSFSKGFITSTGLVGFISWCATGPALRPFNDSTD